MSKFIAMSSGLEAPREGAGFVMRMVVAAVILAGLASPARAQVRVEQDDWNRGYNAFALMSARMGLKLVDAPTWRDTPPEQSLLVAFGAFEFDGDIESYVRQGGAVLLATDRGTGAARRVPGLTLHKGTVHAAKLSDTIQDFRDCPLVTKIVHHPLTREVDGIATNRPGFLGQREGAKMAGAAWTFLATLPPLRVEVELLDSSIDVPYGSPFLAALEAPSGGRAVVVADQSVFANQMLFLEDNFRLMANILSWLGEGRTAMLMLEDRAILSPPMPEEVEVEIPPPTPEEVFEAVRQLPPEVLVPFANSVIASVEDAGIPDELITYLVGRIPELHYRRLLLIVATFCLALVALRKLAPESVAEKAAADDEEIRGGLARRRRARIERQQAARELLERFRADVAETSAIPWPVFASRLRVKDRLLRTWLLRYWLRDASRRLGPASHRYWTRWRLRSLNARVNAWRRLRESGELEYKQ
jgi:hypothetical protein